MIFFNFLNLNIVEIGYFSPFLRCFYLNLKKKIVFYVWPKGRKLSPGIPFHVNDSADSQKKKKKKGILEDFSGQALGLLTVIEFQYMKSQTFCKNQWQACTLPPCPVPPGGRTLHLFHIPPGSNR